MKIKILFIAFLFIALSGCKKEEKETCSDGIQNQGETGVDCGGPCTPCPVPNKVCAGIGTNPFMPIKAGNHWYLDGSFQNDVEITVTNSTTTALSYTYNKIQENLGGEYYLRTASNGDIMILKQSDDTEHLFLPASPTDNQEWNYPISFYEKRKVINTNASLSTSTCTYTGLLQIQVFTSSGPGSTFYFKRGLGMVRTNQITSSVNCDLAEVTLN